MKKSKPIKFLIEPLPINHSQAVEWLMELVRAVDNKTLRKVPPAKFKRGWYSVGFLYPGLHPDEALNHGKKSSEKVVDHAEIRNTEPRLIAPCYAESGWPVVLAPVIKEARRRYDTGGLKDDEYYCSEAVIFGMCNRRPALVEVVRHASSRRTV